jgi:hypothetical protein
MFLSFALCANSSPIQAKDLPSDLCSLLPQAQLVKVLGEGFGAPQKSTAPAPYAANPVGTQCVYSAERGRDQIVFIIYEDPSAAVAKETFNKLSMFFRPNTSVAGVGDSAYIDSKHAIHVLAGTVRYFINISTENEKQVKDLATWVVGQM